MASVKSPSGVMPLFKYWQKKKKKKGIIEQDSSPGWPRISSLKGDLKADASRAYLEIPGNFSADSHKETSAMFPRFPEAGTCGGLSLTGAFISLVIVVTALAAENLCSPLFIFFFQPFPSKVGSLFERSFSRFLRFLISSCYFCSHLLCKWPP